MEFDWDEHNLQHIAQHGVTREEAESAIGRSSLFVGAEIRGGEERLTYLGHAFSGRILVVVVTNRGTKIRVVTAFPANGRGRADFLRFSGEKR